MTAPSSSLIWWSELRHGGVLISPVVLADKDIGFEQPVSPPWYAYDRLRSRYLTFKTWLDKHGENAADAAPLHAWLDAVLDDFLTHPSARWQKGANVAQNWCAETIVGERLRPSRVLFLDDARQKPALLIAVDRSRQVGLGRGRTAYSKLLELLRAKGLKLGLLTNGQQFRIVYAGLDHDAWAEFDAASWFEEGSGREQLHGFLTLLGSAENGGLHPRPHAPYPLQAAVEASRTRQGDLASVLGEQVREAVERILDPIDRAIRKHPAFLDSVRFQPGGRELPQREVLASLYQAASRLIMRMVVALFAEARGLLPRSMEAYNASYGLEGLFEQLRAAQNSEGFLALDEPNRLSAWPRVMALFRVIHDGSVFSDMPVPSYGGMLFRPGDVRSTDPVLRALALFESEQLEVTDARVLEILTRLKIGQVKVRRGRTSTWVAAPVDFADLRTEYIGIMYEGLLDYELKMTGEVMIFLNVGQQPVLPLSILENMPPKNLKDLLDTLSKDKAEASAPEESGGEEEPYEVAKEDASDDAESDAAPEPDAPTEVAEVSAADQHRRRAFEWALKAVEIAGIVKKPKGKKYNQYEFDKAREAAARKLLARVLDQGDLYLVRWGGTRKGSGTFYTKPQLAVPTVHRTLEPLVYSRDDKDRRVPRTPEEVLALKVCDPACGSGSFLIGALNFLTDGLYSSLQYHKRITMGDNQVLVSLPFGKEATGALHEELIPVPVTDGRFESLLKARLKRHVVERCIYGVDINPLAIELAKLSLWLETFDYELPFSFLDHKLRVGNALVGCWIDHFKDYPALAWEREGGDKQHSNGLRFQKDQLTKAIALVKDEKVRGELAEIIESRAGTWLFDEGERNEMEIVGNYEQVRVTMYGLSIIDHDGREKLHLDQLKNQILQWLKGAFDAWCAVWFWSPTKIFEDNGLTPVRWIDLVLDRKTAQIEKDRADVQRLVEEHRFFHWELEFPEVFFKQATTSERHYHGFDAVFGNPPWEILKPNSKEFFSNFDPVYRTYGKQDAILHQTKLFETNPEIEDYWLRYNAAFKAQGNFMRHAAHPFGDPEEGDTPFRLSSKALNTELHRKWRAQRLKRAEGLILSEHPEHPYRSQGSADVNTYKMFLEMGRRLVSLVSRVGMIVPSGLYTDNGTTDLRRLFLEQSRWEWLFGFENRWKIFSAVDERFKFCPVIIQKGGKTEAIRSAFMRHDVTDWEHAEQFEMSFPVSRVTKFSPNTRAILEIRSNRDLAILDVLFNSPMSFGNDPNGIWSIQYSREFHITEDSRSFPPIATWEEKGYFENPCGFYENKAGERALPVYEGRLIDQFDFAAKFWISGKGRSANWGESNWLQKHIYPQYLMDAKFYAGSTKNFAMPKCALMQVASATNTRTVISSLTPKWPGVDKTPFIRAEKDTFHRTPALCGILNSFVIDSVARSIVGGMTLGWYILESLPLPDPSINTIQYMGSLVNRLNCAHPAFADLWFRLRKWKRDWAVTPHERLRLRCILDALVAEIYGLSFEDFAWILKQDKSDPKGFWRVDQDKPLELRHTTLALAAFRDLKEMGLDAFQKLNAGEGWMIPNEVADPSQWSLADQGLIQLPHHLTQPTAPDPNTPTPATARLGPRFLPWQLEGTVEESWKECEHHARQILGEEAFARLMRGEDPYGKPGTAKPMGGDGDDFQLVNAPAKKTRGKHSKDASGQKHMF